MEEVSVLVYVLFKTKLLPIYAGREHIFIVNSVWRSWNLQCYKTLGLFPFA